MAETLTYGQVAAQVSAKCDALDEARLASTMQNCLNEIFNQVCDCPEFQTSGMLTVQPGVCDYPLVLNDGTMLRSVSQFLNPETGKELQCLTDQTARVSDGTTGTPTRFEVWGDTITVYPTPDSATKLLVHGWRDVDCTMFTVDGDGVKNWNTIDLPARLHAAYMNCVLALSYAEQGDYQAAEYWIRIASSAIDSFVAKKQQGPVRRTGILRTDPFCHKPNPCCDDGCCELHGPPVIVQPDKEDKDCHGRPTKPNYMGTLA